MGEGKREGGRGEGETWEEGAGRGKLRGGEAQGPLLGVSPDQLDFHADLLLGSHVAFGGQAGSYLALDGCFPVPSAVIVDIGGLPPQTSMRSTISALD